MNKNLVNDLRAYGLSEWEARGYVALATHGSLTATALSAASHIPVSKVYDVLRNLRHKSLAAVKSTKPYCWCAIEPAAALRSIVESRRVATLSLEAKTVELLDKLRPATTPEILETWTASGKQAFYEKLACMLDCANSDFYIITSNFTRNEIIDNALKSAIKRNVKIRMLCTSSLNNDSRSCAKWYLSCGASVRLSILNEHPIIGIRENNEVIISTDVDDNTEYIWSNHPALVIIVKNFFENVWIKARSLT